MKDNPNQNFTHAEFGQQILERRHDSIDADILIIVCDGGSALALTGLIEPLKFANQTLGREAYSWAIAAYPESKVKLSIGLELCCDTPWKRETPPENVAVIGNFQGPEHLRKTSNKALERKLREWIRHGTRLINVDMAVPILPRDFDTEHQVCVHWKNSHMMRELHPELEISENLFEVTGNSIYSAGGCGVTDLVLQDISYAHGAHLAETVSDLMLRGQSRTGLARQKRLRTNPDGTEVSGLADVLRVMEENIENPLSIAQICERSMVGSRRQMERLFNRNLGTTPWAYYRSLRLEKARSLVERTALCLDEIAAICGFSSRFQMRSVFQKEFGISPTKLRKL